MQYNAMQKYINVPVDDFPESNAWRTSKIDILSAIGDELHTENVEERGEMSVTVCKR